MPVTATKPTAAAKIETEVEQQLAQVVRRIRTHDLLCGVFLLGVAAVGYLAATMTLDRWLDLPAWVRQVGFLGLLAALGLIVHRGLVRPFRQSVNPLYAAREVEETVEDAKNSVVNWVDLQDKPIAEGVRAVVAARAAKQFKDADLDRAGESKRLLWLGGALGGLVVVLAVLFMIFKPTVFGSLFGRAVNPFSSGAIATRTQIELVEPKGGDLTVTAGQPVTITVQIGGKVPDADAPDRLVVLLRHNQADENFDDVPLEQGSSYREWTVRLPERLVQNGFWYRVRGGDAETAEHHVTVRPKPTLTEFDVKYVYPEYLRMPPDAVKSPHLEAHRGTVVTVTAKANRTLKDGRAVLSNTPVPVAGEVVGEPKDLLRVKLTLTESGTYRLLFNSVEGEANADAAVYDLRVLSDQPPTAFVTTPKDEEVTLPVNGTLGIDAQIGDDFGIDKVTLKFKLTAPNQPAKPLKAKPYQNGQSFKRAADGTYPTALDYKDSVELPTLTDEAGQKVELQPDSVLEYWLEATDNCTVPEANVGKSKVQKVRLVPAKVEPQQKDELKKQAEKRKADDAAHQQQQKKKLDQEPRPQKESPQKPNAEPQGEKQEGDKTDQPAGEPGANAPKKADDGQPMPKEGPKAESPMNADPMAKPDVPPMPNDQSQKGADDAAKQNLQRQADEVNKKLDELEQKPGEAKGNDQPQPGQEAPSGEKKAKPMAGQEQGDPKQGGDAAAAEKPKGAEAKPDPAAQPKPTPQEKPSPTNPNEKAGEGDPQEKAGPLGGAGAQEKPTPQPKAEKPNEPTPKQDEGGDTKPMDNQSKDQQAGSSKKDGQQKPAEERKAGQPMGGEPSPEEKGGEAKAEKPTPAGESKKGPKPGDGEKPTPEPKGGGSESKPTGDDATAGKNEGQAQPNQDKKGEQGAKGNPWQRGTEKPSPQDQKGGEQQAGRPEDAAKQRGLEQAAKDLAGNDEQKKDAARQKLDQEIGPDKRKELEKGLDDRKQAADGLNSKDPEQRKRGEDKLTDLQREQMEKDDNAQPRDRKPGDAEQLNRQKEIQNAAKDLNSDDPKKKEDAQKKLDELVGKPAREKAEKLRDDLQSGDKDRQQAAAEELKELQKKAKEQQAKQDGPKGNAAQKEQNAKQEPGKDGQKGNAAEKEQLAKKPETEQAMKDLAGNDEKKKEAAREQLDKTVGKEAREKAEQKLNERKDAAEKMQSKDAKQQEQGKAAAEKLQREEIERGTDAKKPNDADRLDRKQIEEALKDLNSDDKQKQQAARDQLDKAAGKDAREKAEQMMKDLQSGDKDREKAAMDELKKMQNELKKEADRQAQNDQQKGEKGKDQLSPQDIEKLAKAAQDLNAKDEQKRKDAEKQLDDKLGEQARKELQERMKDQAKDGKEPSPEQVEAAKKALEELAKNLPQQGQGPNKNDRDPRRDGGIGNTTDNDSKPLDANKDFDKKAAQLQLEQLKKAEANKELQKKLGYTEEEYKRFLDGYEKMVREMPEPKAEKPDPSKATVPAKPTTRVDSSGTVQRRDDGSKSTTNSAGVSSAPPGYGDARKRFAETATKTPKEKDAPK